MIYSLCGLCFLFCLYGILVGGQIPHPAKHGLDDYEGDTYDDEYPLYHNEELDFNINKCHCKLNEAWSGEVCLAISESEISPKLLVLNEYFQNSSNLSNFFTVKNITCNDTLKASPKITLTGEEDSIFVSDYGELYYQDGDTLIPSTEYCIEFLKIDEKLLLEASICVPMQSIPKCCKSSRECLTNFELTATFGNHHIDVDESDFSEFPVPVCHSNKSLTTVSLNPAQGSINLHFRSGVTDLAWDPAKIYTTPQVFTMGEYCISQEEGKGLFANFCYLDPMTAHEEKCTNSTCVRKCCPEYHYYDVLEGKCSSGQNYNTFLEQINFYKAQTRKATEVPPNLTIEYSFPWCSQGTYLIDPATNPKDEFFLLNNGSLYITLSDVAVPPSQYCIENFIAGNSSAPKVISCFWDQKETVEDKCKLVHDILYPILLVVSCIFLCITLIVYASIPELHAKLHGKSLISHVSSLLGAFMCQLIVSWSSKSLSMTGCKLIALANQVTFLWAFFWLNVMCFDIWWTLKTMSPRPKTGENTRRRFVYYSIYAWGTPVAICIITAIMEFLPASVDTSHLTLPGFGIRGCWYQDMYSTWIYFHGFTLFLYVTNILFFFHVAAILIKEHRSTERILRPTWKQHKERVWLYLKLFVVMGITWICEVASWQEGTCEYWIFTDIINSLQGVFIFFIFMCNRKVFQKIQLKGIPLFVSLKNMIKSPSPKRGSSSSRRTTGTSVESSSRRLSTSLQPAHNALNLETIRENKEDKSPKTSKTP